MIAIEAGLAVALGFMLRTSSNSGSGQQVAVQQFTLQAPLYLLPVLGIIVAVAISTIVIRERKWQSYYVGQVTALKTLNGRLFPVDKDDGGKPVSDQGWSYISKVVAGLSVAICASWLIAGLAIWLK